MYFNRTHFSGLAAVGGVLAVAVATTLFMVEEQLTAVTSMELEALAEGAIETGSIPDQTEPEANPLFQALRKWAPQAE